MISLILDDVTESGTLSLFSLRDFCNDIGKKVKKLSLKANNLVLTDYDAGECLDLDILSLQHSNLLQADIFTPQNGSRSDPILYQPTLWNIRGLDASYMFNTGRAFCDKYCHADNIKNSDFFPRPMKDLPLLQSYEPMPKKNVTSTRLIPIPFKLEYLIADHFALPYTEHIKKAFTRVAHSNNSVKFINLSYSDFITSFIPIGNMWQLQILDLSHSGLTSIKQEVYSTFKTCVNLRHLNISHNHLGQSDSNFQSTFAGLVALMSLDLSYNGIKFLHKEAFVHNNKLQELLLEGNYLTSRTTLRLSLNHVLEHIDLSHNVYSHFADDMIQELAASNSHLSVNISGNPLVCDCNAVNFIKWTQQTNVTLSDNNSLRCLHHNQTISLYQFPVESLEEECTRPNLELLKRKLATGVSLVIALIIAMISLLYHWRWHLRWYYYSLRRAWARKPAPRRDPPLNSEGKYHYDAYVLYNEETDANFVFQSLAPALEDAPAGGCHLFLNGRDDIPGFAKSENIVDGMEGARKILVVVTSDSNKNEMVEFAFHMSLIKGVRHLVILLKGQPDFNTIPNSLRALLKPSSKIPVLEWPEDQYGQKLVLAQIHGKIFKQKFDFNIHLSALDRCTEID